MIRYLKLFLELAVAVTLNNAKAATVNAIDCQQASVSAAINSAQSGDTVFIPSGKCYWSSGLSVTKALSIIGAGSTNTTIINKVNSPYGYALISYQPTDLEAPKTFELSGLTLDGASMGGCFAAAAPSSSTPITGLKIHDNNFINGTSRAVILSGMEFGVFYKNNFDGNYISISSIGAGNAGWNYPSEFGSANFPFFEDNTFGNGTGGFISESGQGGRLVFRHNIINNYACSGCEVFDIHGNQGDRGTVATEIYHNTIDVGSSGTNRWLNHRGGKAVIANNSVTRNISFNITEYTSWGGNGFCSTYPALDQINNSFYWSNTNTPVKSCTASSCLGTPASCAISPYDDAFLIVNREYWLPIAGAEASLPTSCNTGDYFGTTDTDKLFKCVEKDVWSLSYKPFPYPHSLRGQTAQLNAPLNLRIVAL
ncbi:MAG: hypothetical protein ACXVCP_15585 [Bdellovibrio sp.]